MRVKIVDGFPGYLINEKGIVTKDGVEVEKVSYTNRPIEYVLRNPYGKLVNKSPNKLLKENFPDLFEIEFNEGIIYHKEGTLPDENIPLTEFQKRLREYFYYDMESGHLFFRSSGKQASRPTSIGDTTNYLEINFEAELYKEHILIIKYMLGDIFPEKVEIDHVDHNRQNNRWDNLRVVCRIVNSRNLSKHKTNTSGVTGVSWHKAKNKWRAHIMVEYKQIHLGLFSDFDEAVTARKEAENKYGFHKNHGK
jgi:hypothetical protein